MEAAVEGVGDVRPFPAHCGHQATCEWLQSHRTEKIMFLFRYHQSVPVDTLDDQLLLCAPIFHEKPLLVSSFIHGNEGN